MFLYISELSLYLTHPRNMSTHQNTSPANPNILKSCLSRICDPFVPAYGPGAILRNIFHSTRILSFLGGDTGDIHSKEDKYLHAFNNEQGACWSSQKKKKQTPWALIQHKTSSFQYKKAHYEFKKTQHHIVFTTGFPYWLDNIFILNQGLWLHQTWLTLNVQQCRALYWHHPYRRTNVVVKINNLYRINSLLRTKFVIITNNLWRWDNKI